MNLDEEEKELWRLLLVFLNTHKRIQEEKIYRYFEKLTKEHSLTVYHKLLGYLNLLTRIYYCGRIIKITKSSQIIIIYYTKRKLPKKLTLDLALKIKENPWMEWFLFPKIN